MKASLSRRVAFLRFIAFVGLTQLNPKWAFGASSFYLPGFLIRFYIKQQTPITKDFVIAKLRLNELDLGFHSDTQRLSFKSYVEILVGNKTPIPGKIDGSSSFLFDATTKSIFIKNPTIDHLELDPIGNRLDNSLPQINQLLEVFLNDLKVYEFPENQGLLFQQKPEKIVIEAEGIRFYFLK